MSTKKKGKGKAKEEEVRPYNKLRYDHDDDFHSGHFCRPESRRRANRRGKPLYQNFDLSMKFCRDVHNT
jgi:hypothetical protein